MSSDGTLIRLREPKLYFDNVNIESVAQVEYSQHSIEQEITELKGKLLALALATPKDITPNDEDSPVDFVTERVNELFSDLSDAMFDSFSIDIIERIINDWKYSYPDSKDIYENCKTDEDTNSKVFPKDKHVEIKYNLNKFTFAPDDETIDKAIKRSVENINFNYAISHCSAEMAVIVWYRHLFVDYDGQFIFKNKDAAQEILDKKMDLHTSEYISKDFITTHPDFFPSAIEKMKEQYEALKDNEDIYKSRMKNLEDFTKAYNDFKESDFKFDMEIINTLYYGLLGVLRNQIMDECKIKILTIRELVTGYDTSIRFKDLIQKEMQKSLEQVLLESNPLYEVKKGVKEKK